MILNVCQGYDWYSSTLVVLDGATGDHEWEVDGILPLSGVAAGDVDGDGFVDVLAFGATGRIYAFEGDGSPKWTTAGVGG